MTLNSGCMKKRMLFFLSCLLLFRCGNKPGNEASADLPPPRASVAVGHPFTTTLSEVVRLNAVTTYTERENLRATTTGYLESCFLRLGDPVQAGQRAFLLKTKEAEAIGDSLLNDPALGITGRIPIHARRAGVVTQLFFQEGDYVSEGDILAEVTRPASLAIKVYVPFEQQALLRQNQGLWVVLPDGVRLPASVRKVLPSEDVISQTTPYLLGLRQYRFLPENLNALVEIPLETAADALAVPAPAVQSNEEQTEFWIMQVLNDSLAVKRPVQPGIRTDSLIELKNSGLRPADRIVLNGAYGLPDTALIKIVDGL